MNAFQQLYLKGNSKAAEAEFSRLKVELSATGRPSLVARAELVRCALRAASLEFDDCPAFEALRADAGPEELAYANYLSGKTARAANDDALSRLVSYGVKFKTGEVNPGEINAAAELSSEQGWRRPLLAWLGVQAKRAEAAGDRASLERIRRRISLVSSEK
ncbi:MAG: hypothetical protein AB1452_01050 [Pseudomonadota bacterium]